MDINLDQFCILKSNSISMDFETHIIRMSEDKVYLHNSIPPEFILEFMEGSEFTLRAGDRKFRASKLESNGVDMIFSLQDEQSYDDTREAIRTVISPENKLFISFQNPVDNSTILKKKVNDISSIGLAFETPEKNKLFSELRELKELTLEYNDKEVYRGSGKTLHTREVYTESGKEKCLVGLKLETPIDENILSQVKS